jgi:hypothetical protein
VFPARGMGFVKVTRLKGSLPAFSRGKITSQHSRMLLNQTHLVASALTRRGFGWRAALGRPSRPRTRVNLKSSLGRERRLGGCFRTSCRLRALPTVPLRLCLEPPFFRRASKARYGSSLPFQLKQVRYIPSLKSSKQVRSHPSLKSLKQVRLLLSLKRSKHNRLLSPLVISKREAS